MFVVGATFERYRSDVGRWTASEGRASLVVLALGDFDSGHRQNVQIQVGPLVASGGRRFPTEADVVRPRRTGNRHVERRRWSVVIWHQISAVVARGIR